MRILIDLILNNGIFFEGKEFYYDKFTPKEIHDLLSYIKIPQEIFIINGPFYISGYRRALMFAEAVSCLYPVKIYGFDLLRDYSILKEDAITINNKTFIKKDGKFYIQKESVLSTTNYSLQSIAESLELLKLPHNNLLLTWE